MLDKVKIIHRHTYILCGTDPFPRSVYWFIMVWSPTLLRWIWLILGILEDEILQFRQNVDVVIELKLAKLFIRVPGVLVHVTEHVNVSRVHPHQRPR